MSETIENHLFESKTCPVGSKLTGRVHPSPLLLKLWSMTGSFRNPGISVLHTPAESESAFSQDVQVIRRAAVSELGKVQPLSVE